MIVPKFGPELNQLLNVMAKLVSSGRRSVELDAAESQWLYALLEQNRNGVDTSKRFVRRKRSAPAGERNAWLAIDVAYRRAHGEKREVALRAAGAAWGMYAPTMDEKTRERALERIDKICDRCAADVVALKNVIKNHAFEQIIDRRRREILGQNSKDFRPT